jgi:hypothetical protein
VFPDGGAGVEQEHARPKIRIEVRGRWIGQGVLQSHPKVARRGFAGECASGRDGGKREAAAEPPPRAARSRPLDHDLNSAAHIFG